MVEFYSGDPTSSQTIEQLGLDALPTAPDDADAAGVAQGFAGSLGVRGFRSVYRAMADSATPVEGGQSIETPAPLSAEDANKQFGIGGGVLSFDKPISAAAAKDLYDAKHATLMRQDAIERSGVSGIRQMTASMMGGLLDPTNLALGLVPGFGEARVAEAFGGGLLARTAGRVVQGATGGALGMVAAEPLNYALDQQEHNDWTAGEALRNIAFGGVLGGGLHVIGGAIGDRVAAVRERANPITERVEAVGQDGREALSRVALAQHLDGRPVEVAPLLDALEAGQAEAELTRWHRQQQDTEAAILQDAPALKVPTDRAVALSAGEERLRGLRAQADEYRQQLADLSERLAPDAATADRLKAVDQELAGTIPAARRGVLMRERVALTEGRDPASDALEQARTKSELTGVQAASDRTERAATKVEAELARLQERVGTETAVARVQQAATTRTERIRQARLAGREAVTQEMTERSIRRLAGQASVRLDPAEVTTLARRVLMAAPDQVAVEIKAVSDRITEAQREVAPITAGTIGGPEAGPGASDAAMFDARTRLRQEQRGAVTDLNAAGAAPDTALVADDRAMAARAEAAPQVMSARGSEAQAEAQTAADRVTQQLQVEVAAGRVRPEELQAIDEVGRRSEGDARAHEAAAACLVARGI